MADTMQFDLVSPERMLASVQASAVRIPGVDGDLTAMPGHTPVITTLRPGLVAAEGPEGNTDYVVSGGFAEITADSVSVLAERAVPRAEVTAASDVYKRQILRARATVSLSSSDSSSMPRMAMMSCSDL